MDFIGFEKSIDIMKNPIAHFTVLEDDLLVHEHSILQIAADAAQNYSRQEFVAFGEKLGKIMRYATEEKQELDTERRFIDSKQIAELFQGLFSATNVGTFNFTDLLICVDDMDRVALLMDEDVKVAKKIMNDTDWQNRLGDAIGFVMVIMAGVQQFKQGVPACKAAFGKADWTQWNHIEDVVYNMDTNMQVIENDIMVNGKAITRDLEYALNDFRNENYKNFGLKIGDLLVEATAAPEDMFLF